MAEGFLSKLGPIQRALRKTELAGWLLVDGGHNRVAQLLLSALGKPRRRYAFWVPAEGFPVSVVHRLDTGIGSRFPGESCEYDSWRSFRDRLGTLLPKGKRIAMEYAPMGSHPYLDQVSAGVLELVRSYDVFVVSSGDLLAQFLGPLSDAEKSGHRALAGKLDHVFSETCSRLTAQQQQEGISPEQRDTHAKHVLDHLIGEHGVEPLRVDARTMTSLSYGQFMLLHASAKESGCATELTRTVALQTSQHPIVQSHYDALHSGLAVVHDWMLSRMTQGRRVLAFEMDQLIRNHFVTCGVGDSMDHALGHAVGSVTPLGEAGLLDSFEALDTRQVFPNTAWVLKPSLKLENVRIQLSDTLLVGEAGVEWTSLSLATMPSVGTT